MNLDPTKPDPLLLKPDTAVERNIELLREQGCCFPISHYELVCHYKNVGTATVQEMARRGLVKCGEIWDGSLSSGLAGVLEEMGITSRADFREKYIAGKLQIERWRNVGRYKLNLLLKWAGLPLPDDDRHEVKMMLNMETCAKMKMLIKERGLASREELVTQLVAECSA